MKKSAGNAFALPEDEFTGRFSKNVFLTLKEAYRPYLGRILFSLLIGFVGRLLLLGNANILGIWVDSLCANSVSSKSVCQSLPSWAQNFSSGDFIGLLFITVAIGFVLSISFRVIFSRLSAQAVSRLYDETTLRTSRYPMTFFDSTPTGRIVTRFSSDYGSIFRLFGGPLAEFFSILFDLVCMVILISVASVQYLPLVMIAILLNWFTYRVHRDPLRKTRRDISKLRGPSIAHFAESTQGGSSIRTFGKAPGFLRRFFSLDHSFNDQRLISARILFRFGLSMNFITAFFFLSAGFVVLAGLHDGWITIGSVGVAFGFIVLSGNSVQMFFEWMSQFEEALVGVERMDNYLRRQLEPGAELPSSTKFKIASDPARPTPISSNSEEFARSLPISFNQVWFRYRDHLPYVLKNLNFNVESGEKLGIIGRTGSGKSSLIQALFHLYPIDKGEISIGEFSPSKISLNRYRSLISYISQDPILFQGTLHENLDITLKTSHQELYNILKQVGLDFWASPKGLEFAIEEKGRNLSLGERQLICMARCLLQKSPIVVLDEATASVDPQSEEIMVKATETFFSGRTQIIIAHRLSTLEKCDRILWLKSGEVYKIGHPQQIIPEFESTQLTTPP